MALVNDAKKEIHAKIVYYGPGRSGKTTNLEFIYNKLKPEYRGKFKFMNTPSGRMVFFDFMRPELAAVKDYGVYFHVYTVPGETVDASIWKNVLKGVDGLVFVADMESSRMLENRRSLDNLKEYLEASGRRLDDTPCIFQCNKRDAADAVSIDEIRNLLDLGDAPVIPAAAKWGEGVLPALSEMVKLVLQRLRDLPVGREEEQAAAAAAPQEPLQPAAEDVRPAVEPDTATEESELLVVEPVGEDVESGEEESAEPLLSAPEEPVAVEEPALAFAEPEFLAEEPEEPARDMVDVDAPFPAPAPGGVAEAATEESFTPAMPDQVAGRPDTGAPEIELAGDLETLGKGSFRIPLVIRHDGTETRAAITLAISLEKTSWP